MYVCVKDEKRRRETATRFRPRPGFNLYIETLSRYVVVVVFLWKVVGRRRSRRHVACEKISA